MDQKLTFIPDPPKDLTGVVVHAYGRLVEHNQALQDYAESVAKQPNARIEELTAQNAALEERARLAKAAMDTQLQNTTLISRELADAKNEISRLKTQETMRHAEDAPKLATHPWDQIVEPTEDNILGQTARTVIANFKTLVADWQRRSEEQAAVLDELRAENTSLKLSLEAKESDDSNPLSQASFSAQVVQWVEEAFGERVLNNRMERVARFLEEALELVQACDMSKSFALKLLNYTWDRDKHEISREVGGVMVTLAALCHAFKRNLPTDAWDELRRCQENIETIRSKHKLKPAPLRPESWANGLREE
jgi:NTP pyrophosphatase (non-canonical NTP hydrolase)